MPHCPHCQRSFVRREHLTRHVVSTHQHEKPYVCEVCAKGFARQDSYNRHRASHTNRIFSGGAHQTLTWPHSRPRTQRACDNCASSRAKCDGTTDCARCASRCVPCTYTSRQAKRAATQSSPNRVLLSAPQLEGDLHSRTRISEAMPHLATPSSGAFTGHPESITDPTIPSAISPAGAIVPGPSIPEADGLWPENVNWLPIGYDQGILPDLDFDTFVNAFQLEDQANAEYSDQLVFDTNQHGEGAVATESIDASRSPHSSLCAGSPMSIQSGKRKRQDLYLNGRGARASLQARTKLPSPRPPAILSRIRQIENETEQHMAYRFLAADDYSWPASASVATPKVNMSKYLEMRQQFSALATSDAHTKAVGGFTSLNFPPIGYVEHCFSLFFNHVDPEMPLIHRSVWEDPSIPWFLILAAVTVGSALGASHTAFQANLAFQEFLRRSIQWLISCDEYLGQLPLAQACFFNVVSVSQMPAEYVNLRLLCAIANLRTAISLLIPLGGSIDHEEGSEGAELHWQDWVQRESQTRILLRAWQLDMFLAFSTNLVNPPQMPAQGIDLPCDTMCWDARNPADWKCSFVRPSRSRTFSSALRQLYMSQKIDDELDNLARTFLIYGTLGRTEEVAQDLQEPLRLWLPAPENNHRASDCPREKSLWLPGDQTYSAWRNSACDCLDTLHWKANSEIAAARGIEDPIVLHLHLARLILLCPYKDLICLAADVGQVPRSYAAPSRLCGRSQDKVITASTRPLHSILKWLTLDGHKGRLCLVHAGATLWHLRRYSRGLHHEPFAAFLAALVIWTYGRYQPSLQASAKSVSATSHLSQMPDVGNNRVDLVEQSDVDSEDDDTLPRTILIDRPCDDEIVQAFVRKGFDMSVDMSGIGPISTPYGLRRVIFEAMRLLCRPQYANFYRSRDYQHVLASLHEVSTSVNE